MLKMDKPSLKIIIAGGKTGGHLFPGIAIAQAFLAIDPLIQVLFVGTGEPFESNTLDRYGFSHTAISISGIKGKGLMDKFFTFLKIPLAMVQTLSIIKRFRPDFVMGVGGLFFRACCVWSQIVQYTYSRSGTEHHSRYYQQDSFKILPCGFYLVQEYKRIVRAGHGLPHRQSRAQITL